MTNIQFTKMHGLGNDFVVIDAISQKINLSTKQIKYIADRHFGIGCDQLLLVEKSSNPQADFRYRIFNANGVEVAQCGNGARCFVKFVHAQGLTTKKIIKVETNSGIITLEVMGEVVVVDMGEPNFLPASLPFLANTQANHYRIEANGKEYSIGAVSVGNPHAIIMVDDIKKADVLILGAAIETHPLFPEQVNVGFMQILNRHEYNLRVYERGVGETLACGTGACAAMAVARMRGAVESPATAHLTGGDLTIDWQGLGQNLMMTGPATTVFDGKIYL